MGLKRLHHQSGIALGTIIFIIAVIALLAVAIAAGSSGFNANTGTESAKVMAEAIINYADAVAMGLRKVRIDNSCDDLSITTTQISFANPMDSSYANSYAPTNGSCNIFDPRGGGIVWSTVPTAALDGINTSGFDYGNYAIYDQQSLENTGAVTDGTGAGIDIILIVPYLSNAVCQQINQIVLNTRTIYTGNYVADANTSRHFHGTYWSSNPGYQIPFSQPEQCIYAQINSALINIGYFLLMAR